MAAAASPLAAHELAAKVVELRRRLGEPAQVILDAPPPPIGSKIHAHSAAVMGPGEARAAALLQARQGRPPPLVSPAARSGRPEPAQEPEPEEEQWGDGEEEQWEGGEEAGYREHTLEDHAAGSAEYQKAQRTALTQQWARNANHDIDSGIWAAPFFGAFAGLRFFLLGLLGQLLLVVRRQTCPPLLCLDRHPPHPPPCPPPLPLPPLVFPTNNDVRCVVRLCGCGGLATWRTTQVCVVFTEDGLSYPGWIIFCLAVTSLGSGFPSWWEPMTNRVNSPLRGPAVLRPPLSSPVTRARI